MKNYIYLIEPILLSACAIVAAYCVAKVVLGI